MPPIKQFEEKMELFYQEQEQMKEIISRYDDALSLKANKAVLFEIEKIVYDNNNKMKGVIAVTESVEGRFEKNDK